MNQNIKRNFRKVNVIIKSEQFHQDIPPIVIENNTEGELIRFDSGWKIVYRETAESGLENTVTTILVSDNNNVRMDRSGLNTVAMEFVAGKNHTSIMNTPYGSITISFMTNKVEADINESGGTINLSYSINSFGEYPVRTNLNISVGTDGQRGKYNWK